MYVADANAIEILFQRFNPQINERISVPNETKTGEVLEGASVAEKNVRINPFGQSNEKNKKSPLSYEELTLGDALESGDPQRIFREWKRHIEDDWDGTKMLHWEFCEEDQERYGDYRKKMEILGGDGIDQLVIPILPELYERAAGSVDRENDYWELYLHIRYFLFSKEASKQLAEMVFRGGNSQIDILISGCMYWCSGEKVTALKIFSENIEGAEKLYKSPGFNYGDNRLLFFSLLVSSAAFVWSWNKKLLPPPAGYYVFLDTVLPKLPDHLEAFRKTLDDFRNGRPVSMTNFEKNLDYLFYPQFG